MAVKFFLVGYSVISDDVYMKKGNKIKLNDHSNLMGTFLICSCISFGQIVVLVPLTCLFYAEVAIFDLFSYKGVDLGNVALKTSQR